MRVAVISVAFLVLFVSVNASRVPSKSCKRGLFDPKGCSCKCNTIGKLFYPMYCLVNNFICQVSGVGLRDGCCEEFIVNGRFSLDPLITQARSPGYSGSSSR